MTPIIHFRKELAEPPVAREAPGVVVRSISVPDDVAAWLQLRERATAGLSPADIAQPIRAILRKQENAEVILDEVKEVHLDTREVVTGDLTIKYDYLIAAAFMADAAGLSCVASRVAIKRVRVGTGGAISA